MKSFIFDFITSSLSLFEDPIHNYIAMALIGAIAYVIAFRTVGELGLRGEVGSIFHWIIRFIVFILTWLLCCIIIKTVRFIRDNWIMVTIDVIALIILYLAGRYAKGHPNSVLNKKLF